jgi:hypothetical protein
MRPAVTSVNFINGVPVWHCDTCGEEYLSLVSMAIKWVYPKEEVNYEELINSLIREVKPKTKQAKGGA